MRLSRVATFALLSFLGCKDKTSAPAPVASAKPAPVVAPAPEAGQADSGQAATQLLDPGSDPKSPMAYAFSGTTRVVDATVKRSQVAGEAVPGAEATFHFTFTATPKPEADGGATIDLKVTKLEIGVPPSYPKEAKAEMHALERSFVGVAVHFHASVQGEISDPRYDVNEASEAVDMMSRLLEMLTVPLPTVPVGVGARWATTESRHDEDGTDITGTVTATLVARDAKTATLQIEAINTGSMPIPDPSAPKGSSLQRTASSHAQSVIRFDGVAVRSDGDSKLDVTQKVPGQPDQQLSIKVVKSLTSK